MRNYLVILILLATTAGIAAQDSPQAMFDQANRLFEQGQTLEAMQAYRAIEEEGYFSGALYLNLGIAAVQLDSMGLAKAYFLKAKEFSETQAEAIQALSFVESQFSRQSAKLPKLPWDKAIDWMIEVPGPTGVFLTGFVITLAGQTLLFLSWFGIISSAKKNIWYSSSLIALGFIITLTAFYVEYVNQRYDEAVMISEESRVLQSPEPGANLVSIAYEGYDLTVDRNKSAEHPQWYYVRLSNGQFGWIKMEGIMMLKN